MERMETEPWGQDGEAIQEETRGKGLEKSRVGSPRGVLSAEGSREGAGGGVAFSRGLLTALRPPLPSCSALSRI